MAQGAPIGNLGNQPLGLTQVTNQGEVPLVVFVDGAVFTIPPNTTIQIPDHCHIVGLQRAREIEAEANQRAREIEAEANRKYLESHAKALKLFHEWLTPEQQRDYNTPDTIPAVKVKGSHGGEYVIYHTGNSFNVTKLHHGKPMTRLCFYPSSSSYLPGDVMLAQKLMLELDEPQALRIANAMPVSV